MKWTLSKRWLARFLALGLTLSWSEAVLRAAEAEPGDTATVLQDHVNVRLRPGTGSEVVARLRKGEQVIVFEETSVAGRGATPAAKWFKVALTNRASAWVSRLFVSSNHVVVPKFLNLRAGPGEDSQLLGRLPRGTKLKIFETNGDWVRIESGKPTYGYVAASLLKQQTVVVPAVAAVPPQPARSVPPPPAVGTNVAAAPFIAPVPIALTPPPEAVTIAPAPVPEPVPVTVTPPPVTAAAEPPVAPVAPVEMGGRTVVVQTNAVLVGSNVLVVPPLRIPMPSSTPPPGVDVHIDRLVAREGTVRAAINIQAPAYHELLSVHSGRVINYLYTTNINIKPFRGKRVIVSGREYLDARWRLTPVLVIETLETVPAR